MVGNHTKDLTDIRAEVPAEQLEWLQNDLSATTKPTMIFTHYGVAEDDMVGNFGFEGEPQHALLGNRKEVWQLLETTGDVIAL